MGRATRVWLVSLGFYITVRVNQKKSRKYVMANKKIRRALATQVPSSTPSNFAQSSSNIFNHTDFNPPQGDILTRLLVR